MDEERMTAEGLQLVAARRSAILSCPFGQYSRLIPTPLFYPALSDSFQGQYPPPPLLHPPLSVNIQGQYPTPLLYPPLSVSIQGQ